MVDNLSAAVRKEVTVVSLFWLSRHPYQRCHDFRCLNVFGSWTSVLIIKASLLVRYSDFRGPYQG